MRPDNRTFRFGRLANKLLKLAAFRVEHPVRSPVVEYHGLGWVDRDPSLC
jgi:hypothetical protein